ncbi:hypothetical protein A3Q56_02186 [Intoshia linei]|uniref:DnaJ subfamily A member 1 n=1 Tax=Intoshia linei TaxID=1819745 RepID=A0A177B6X3_9BILA|nr:hypothetical protein A3Q56_02186 [Intoshia linei]
MVKETKLYDLLDIQPSATVQQIKTAYRKMALKYHPDKNSAGAEKFKEITEAYDILLDPKKRDLYNKHGMKGMRADGQMGAGHNDIFDMFFGGGGSKSARSERGADMQHKINVSLKELYCGCKRSMLIKRKEKCPCCDGKGGKDGANVSCGFCKGQGVQIKIHQMMPGMVQQVQTVCSHCKGKGLRMRPEDCCKRCKGEQYVIGEKNLTVNVNPGMKNEERIEFNGEADWTPGVAKPGNVYIFLIQQEDPNFKREKDNLLMEMDISLTEALTGFTRYVTTYDDRVLKIEPPVNDPLIKPGDILMISNEGMPRYGSISIRGYLKIQFNVMFPDHSWVSSLTDQKMSVLKTILPQVSQPPENPSAKECFLKRSEGSNGGVRTYYDEEDEDETHNNDQHGQRVQCASQ